MDVRERDLEDLFGKFGNIRDIDIKVRERPPAFAFVEFSSEWVKTPIAMDCPASIMLPSTYPSSGGRNQRRVYI